MNEIISGEESKKKIDNIHIPHRPSSIKGLMLNFNINKYTRNLFLIVALLAFFSILLQSLYFQIKDYKYIVNLFDLDNEGNIPTLFSSLNLFTASFLLFLIHSMKRIREDKFKNRWLFLAFLFFVMGADEFLQLHEQTSQIFRPYLHGFYFGWIVPGVIFVTLFIVYYLKFFFSLEIKWKIRFFAAAAIYVFGALGMELISGIYWITYGKENIGYILVYNTEEILEMSGIILFINTLLHYIKSLDISLNIKLNS